ncbi:transcriptional repressor [Alkaliphilus pronyensis]|uniref:Transcriptional repressor n=1 Tax=Alkaliphilus pronyensis TaxID=1482732 RepID=A0A6I0FFV8_9FIRM|nr:Fur family transcriptional regulator [Alkaliphilus pronyensis]KAB3537258.1 transcriptional repressor [Alkaliphilus pronyensis]
MEFLEEKLKRNGYKITKHRRAILNIFLESEEHLLTAAEIYNRIISEYNNINFSTVYRNLEAMTKANVVKRFNLDNGVNYYELNEGVHHHHLICLECGQTKITNYCPLKEPKFLMIHDDFTPVDHKLEIYGYCKKCNKG